MLELKCSLSMSELPEEWLGCWMFMDLITVAACAIRAFTSAGLSEKIMVLLFWPMSEYIAMYCVERE